MTDWSRYLAYRCRHCREDCINLRGSDLARDRECRTCGAVPELEDARPTDSYQLTTFSLRRSPSCSGNGSASTERPECRMGVSPARRRREERTAPPRPEHRERSDRPRSGQGGPRGSSGNETEQLTLTDGGFDR